ncbi:hypothetical protein DFJ58DRAFT_885233 [Suillus subalutaceus]|uniref:uncharacterized protein n=1 Tax=Suillus subalutaceus TaxID=48586 RepID=UPI001B86865C|nr:uncharacterized protein DFJ58DRAFT_885233 [Suillus subalutaceus]KAG1852435.1 hypothetical protein DFJ58DRAFT_885233 [Suillus subalutaceus]
MDKLSSSEIIKRDETHLFPSLYLGIVGRNEATGSRASSIHGGYKMGGECKMGHYLSALSKTPTRAHGIQLFAEVVGGQNEEDIELDGLGIPTVELCMKHSTDECKSNTRKRKRKKKTTAVEGAPARKVPWYEEWEEGEDLRIMKESRV